MYLRTRQKRIYAAPFNLKQYGSVWRSFYLLIFVIYSIKEYLFAIIFFEWQNEQKIILYINEYDYVNDKRIVLVIIVKLTEKLWQNKIAIFHNTANSNFLYCFSQLDSLFFPPTIFFVLFLCNSVERLISFGFRIIKLQMICDAGI